jgi:DNA ligase-1
VVDANKGIGLRFPRLIKVREDKKPDEASTNDFVIDLYRQQAVVQNRAGHDDEDDYY